MAGTFSQLHFHIIFSTKNRTPSIHPEWRVRLWEYMGGIVKGEGGTPILIGGVSDHVHMLLTLKPKHDVSSMVQKIKAKSSGWCHEHFPMANMWWQDGFGAFSVSHSLLVHVERYIAGQEQHHCKQSFQDEFRGFLEKHQIPYDERYIWD